MKKIISLITLVIFASLCFSSCGNLISNGDTTYSNAPTVESFSSGFSISVTYRSQHTDYIYIFRKNLTDNTDPVCIGFISQKAFLPNNVYQFEDSCVSPGKKYAYSAVYHDKNYNAYNATSWTADSEDKGIEPKAGEGEKNNIYNEINKVIYNPINETLTFPVIPSNGSFNHSLRVSLLNEDKTEVVKTKIFQISPAEEDSISDFSVKLRNIVSDDFLSGSFRIEAILGEKLDYKENSSPEAIPVLKRAIWTTPYSLEGKIFSTFDIPVNEISLETANADGYEVPSL